MKTVHMMGISLLLFMLLSGGAYAATINVGPGYTYSTIQSGVSAASSGDTVSVHAGTYTLTSPITMKSGVHLQGSGYDNCVIRVTDKSKFNSEAEAAMIMCSGISNAEISGFKFIGPGLSYADVHDEGQAYYGGHGEYHHAIKLSGCDHINIHDNYCTLLLNDFVRFSTRESSNVNIYNNQMVSSGHDGVQCWNGRNVKIYNNNVVVFINCAFRIANSPGGCEVYGNTISSYSDSGWCGVQIQGSTTGLYVHDNVFRDMHDNYCIAGYQSTASGCTITNNAGYNIPAGMLKDCSGASLTGNSVSSNSPSGGYNSGSTSGGGGTAGGNVDIPTTPYNGSYLPAMYSPSNGASVPLVNGEVTFNWQNVNSTSYAMQVSTTSNFSTIVYTGTMTGTTKSVPLNVSTTYYWHVAAYNDVGHTWGGYSSAQSFTTTAETQTTGSGVYGTITDSSTGNPIQGASVTLTSGNSSTSAVTGEDGHYEFSPGAGTYYIIASAQNYQTTPEIPITVESTSYIEQNIAMAPNSEYNTPHYVKFIITDTLLTARYNATVSVYNDGEQEAAYSATTGTDGSVTFELKETTKYNIVTVCNGTTQTDSIMPVDTMYYIVVDENSPNLPSQFYEDVDINITKTPMNDTYAYVNVTYTDKHNTSTNSLNVTIGQHDNNGTFVPIGNPQTFSNHTISSNNGTVTASFVVKNYKGQTYTERIIIDHTKYGVVTKWHADAFKGSNLPFDGKILAYFCIFILFIVGMQFGAADHATGAILLCGMFWFMYFVSAFEPLGDTIDSFMFGGGSLATIYALMAYINDKRREVGV